MHPALAQQKIVVANGSQTNKEIPLEANSTIAFDSAGNLTVQCALTSGVCTPLAGTGGGAGPVPTITSFERNDGDADVRAGEFVRVTWATSAASPAAACAASFTGANNTFVGVREINNGAGEVVTLPTAGTYTLNLQCFNAAGASAQRSIEVVVGEATSTPPPAGNCNISDPLIQPAGWTRTNRTWEQAWSSYDGSPVAVYPQSVGWPVPVGAAKGGYTVIPFTPAANQIVGISWEHVQANSIEGYRNPRPAEKMFFSISPCPGDVRAPAPGNADMWLRGGCRRMASAAGLIFATLPDLVSNEMYCRLEAGQTYYLNVMAADPTDGLTPGEHTCESVPNSANGCDVQATHRPQ